MKYGILFQNRDSSDCTCLPKKDLHNIEMAYNMQSSTVKHKDVSVEAWVKEIEIEDSCILLYKPQGIILEDYPQFEKVDFVLMIMNTAQNELLKKFGNDCVCVDGTHRLNSFNFELVSRLYSMNLDKAFLVHFT